jgi:hypothetical protein
MDIKPRFYSLRYCNDESLYRMTSPSPGEELTESSPEGVQVLFNASFRAILGLF